MHHGLPRLSRRGRGWRGRRIPGPPLARPPREQLVRRRYPDRYQADRRREACLGANQNFSPSHGQTRWVIALSKKEMPVWRPIGHRHEIKPFDGSWMSCSSAAERAICLAPVFGHRCQHTHTWCTPTPWPDQGGGGVLRKGPPQSSGEGRARLLLGAYSATWGVGGGTRGQRRDSSIAALFQHVCFPCLRARNHQCASNDGEWNIISALLGCGDAKRNQNKPCCTLQRKDGFESSRGGEETQEIPISSCHFHISSRQRLKSAT